MGEGSQCTIPEGGRAGHGPLKMGVFGDGGVSEGGCVTSVWRVVGVSDGCVCEVECVCDSCVTGSVCVVVLCVQWLCVCVCVCVRWLCVR